MPIVAKIKTDLEENVLEVRKTERFTFMFWHFNTESLLKQVRKVFLANTVHPLLRGGN